MNDVILKEKINKLRGELERLENQETTQEAIKEGRYELYTGTLKKDFQWMFGVDGRKEKIIYVANHTLIDAIRDRDDIDITYQPSTELIDGMYEERVPYTDCYMPFTIGELLEAQHKDKE